MLNSLRLHVAWQALVFLSILTSSVQAEDWTQWRGANRDGVWQVEGVVDTLPEGQLPLDWSVEIGAGYNGPTVADGRVFVMDRVTEPREMERVLCFDSASGRQLWKHEYPTNYTISYTAGPRASVTIDGERAYAVGAMGDVKCLDVAKGEVLWEHALDSEYELAMPIWGIAASPLVYKDLVIQQAAVADACMVAFDKTTGAEVWKALPEKASYASPIIVQRTGADGVAHDVLVCWTGESLSGLDPRTGKVYWAHAMPPSRMPIGIGTPTIDGNRIFVSSFYDGSMMVELSEDGLSSELLWRAVGPDEQHTESLHAMIGTSILDGDYVYGVDSYGEFRCLDAKTGERIWEDQTAVPRSRWATIHMVRQADRVWMFNERGDLLIAKLSPQGLEILDRAHLIDPTRVQLNKREGVCWSHPAFAEKSVFARSDEKLVRASLAK
ncbi:MAG: PQQ-binding-like beta-propeller repeat protein [Pirellulaceae bacterium]